MRFNQLDDISFSISSASFTTDVKFSTPVGVMTTLSSILQQFQISSRNGKSNEADGLVDLPHTTNVPVLLQHIHIDVLRRGRILQRWVNDEFAEVDLCHRDQRQQSGQ